MIGGFDTSTIYGSDSCFVIVLAIGAISYSIRCFVIINNAISCSDWFRLDNGVGAISHSLRLIMRQAEAPLSSSLIEKEG
jgi:hypothetical protein